MRYLRFHHKDFVGYGRLEGDLIRAIEGDLFGTYKVTETTVPFAAARLLAPCLPTKIVAIGVNYKDHAAEFKKELPSEPLMFLKPPSALLAPEEAIVYPEGVTKRVDYEGELAVVIKKRARHVTPEQAAAAIFGYTCCNDVTAAELLKKHSAIDGWTDWTRAKSFDTFGPIGPWIVTGLDPATLSVKSILDGQERQNYPVSDMLFGPARLVALVSRDMTLFPGDIISCGTSVGVGSMKPGSTIEIRIGGIGTLSNRFE